MKTRRLVIIIYLVVIGILVMSGCRNTTSVLIRQHTENYITGELENGFQKTTIAELDKLIDSKLPVPEYLPAGYKIQEVYFKEVPETVPHITEIMLFISDLPVKWTGNKYESRLVYNIGWNEASLGLKMPWAELIPGLGTSGGRLATEDNEYNLWWASYGGKDALLGSTLRLFASTDFSKDELIKIADSTIPTVSPDLAQTLDVSIEPVLGTALIEGILLEQATISAGILDRSGRNGWYPEVFNAGDPCLIIYGTLKNITDENFTVNIWAKGFDAGGEQAAWTLDIDPGPLAGIAQKDVTANSSREFELHLGYTGKVDRVTISASLFNPP